MVAFRFFLISTILFFGGATIATAGEIQLGTTIGGGFFNLPDQQRAAAYAHMHSVGITTIRTDASWGYFEPSRGTYQTETYDKIAHELAENGFRWLPILDYSALWAGQTPGDPFSRPADLNTYADFAERFVRRYGAGGELAQIDPAYAARPVAEVELWNEPNTDLFWKEQATGPQDYGAMVSLTVPRIKSASPSTKIILGGLLDSGADAKTYLRQLLTLYPNLLQSIDRVGWHPYQYFQEGNLSSVAAARKILDDAGYPNMPLDLTEMGWARGMVQPSEITDTLRQLRSGGCGVARVVVYTWQGTDGMWDITNPDESLTAVGGGVVNGMMQSPLPNTRCITTTDDGGSNNDGNNGAEENGGENAGNTAERIIYGNKRGTDKRTRLAYTWVKQSRTNAAKQRTRSLFTVKFTTRTKRAVRKKLNGQSVTLSCNGTVEKSRLNLTTKRRWGKRATRLTIALKTLPQSGVCDVSVKNKILMTFTMK